MPIKPARITTRKMCCLCLKIVEANRLVIQKDTTGNIICIECITEIALINDEGIK